MPALNTPTKRTATDRFISGCLEFDELLKRLQALREDHFYADPEAVLWGDVGSLEHVNSRLRDALAHYGMGTEE
jgi:hypothetical protein